MNVDNVKAQMRKGILEYCILAILSRNDAYASAIISELKEAEMIVVEGTLYPILTRQKNQGLLAYRWEESPQGPPRKYYTITKKGLEFLQLTDIAWNDFVEQIYKIRNGNIGAESAQSQRTEPSVSRAIVVEEMTVEEVVVEEMDSEQVK